MNKEAFERAVQIRDYIGILARAQSVLSSLASLGINEGLTHIASRALFMVETEVKRKRRTILNKLRLIEQTNSTSTTASTVFKEVKK